MTWTETNRAHVSGPYSVIPVARGYDVWITGTRRIGRDIKTLRAARALAELHSKGETRISA